MCLIAADPKYSSFTAHSFRGTAASLAFSAGVSIQEILNTVNWSNAKTFHKFYHKEVINNSTNFADSVLNSV